MASELAIAAIEKNGGVVTTAFYDPRSLGKYSRVSFSLSISYCPLFVGQFFVLRQCSQLRLCDPLEHCTQMHIPPQRHNCT